MKMLKIKGEKIWEDWKWVGVWVVIVLTGTAIVLGVLGVGDLGEHRETGVKHRQKRYAAVTGIGGSYGKGRDCWKRYGGVELNYTRGATTSFTFDLCNVINCGGQNSSYRGYDIYLCGTPGFDYACHTNQGHPEGCPSWYMVTKFTGRWVPTGIGMTGDWKTKVSFQRDFSTNQNPVTLSFNNVSYGGLYTRNKEWNRTTAYMILGVDVSGSDPKGMIKVNIIDPVINAMKNQNQTITTIDPDNNKQTGEIIEVDYTKMKPEDIIEKATGYGDNNLWLEWVVTTSRESGLDDCIGCANARPRLYTEPAPLFPEDKWGYNCMLALTRQSTPTNCSTLASIFPPLNNHSKAGPFTPIKANYTCFNITGRNVKKQLGDIRPDWCNTTTLDNGTIIGPWARAGLYYYCGGRRLVTRIPKGIGGVCAMVRLGAPITLIGEKMKIAEQTSLSSITRRRRRHILRKRSTFSVDLSINSPTYIDAIGVPRGVPNEYKLVDQISAGMENIPLISALFPITPNKKRGQD